MSAPHRALLLSLLLPLPACYASTPPILTDRATEKNAYAYVVVDAEDTDDVEAVLDRASIVTRFEDDGEVAYVVPPEAASRLAPHANTLGALDHATMRVRLTRLGDDGWGTTVNAMTDVAQGADVHFTDGDVGAAFAELQEYTMNPWATVTLHHDALFRKVARREQTSPFELGFRLALSVELWGGNPGDPEAQALLYAFHTESPYVATTPAR